MLLESWVEFLGIHMTKSRCPITDPGSVTGFYHLVLLTFWQCMSAIANNPDICLVNIHYSPYSTLKVTLAALLKFMTNKLSGLTPLWMRCLNLGM